MKYIDEYRDPTAAEFLVREIKRVTTRPWTIMEICGGQTHAIVKNGIDLLLPEQITLLHGPGCPVCVTPVQTVDNAIDIAGRPNVTFCSFGDMMRVPGSSRDLLSARADGADIRTVYSPLDAVRLAAEDRSREVVFFAIGFETTAPANAMAVFQAQKEGLDNFSMLVSQALVPPAIDKILSSRDCKIQGFLAAGHVCTVMGYREYETLAEKHDIPMTVTGFEPLDILQGIYLTISSLEEDKREVRNQYSRAVSRDGNKAAQNLIREVFRNISREWRGIGWIDNSGLGLKDEYSAFDAEIRYGLTGERPGPDSECISGEILQGIKKPYQCPVFGTRCTPENPLGATMVTSEGACAAYFRYRKKGDSLERASKGSNNESR